MSEEYLKSFGRIEQEVDGCMNIYHIEENDIDIVKKALLELKAIKEADPSEALKCLELLGDFEWHNRPFKECFPDLFDTIKNYILKTQEPSEKLVAITDETRN